MKHHPVHSSTISSIGFDSESGQMEVSFKSGKVYNFSNVSAEKFSDFLKSESKGKYFHREFRGNPNHAVETKND